MKTLLRRTAMISVLGVLAALLTIVAGSSPAAATHFRANQLTWQKVSGTTADFHATGSWRCTFYADPCTYTVGDPINPASIEFGDGDFSTGSWTVTGVDVANDVVSAELEENHVYATSGPFTAVVTGCCRLSGPNHINNADGDLVVETIVDLAATTASPISSISPIVDCPLNAVCQFTVPAFDPDGQGLRYRFSTAAEAGAGFFVQPGPPDATSSASINATTGQYTWDTTGATLSATGSTFYSTQVTIENVVSNVVVSKTAVDFFIRLGSNSTNQQPVFNSPTPADGSVLNAVVGQQFTFSTAASDPDSTDVVTLGMIGKPATATYTSSPGNPTTGTFTWTPSGTGTVLLTLTAQDQLGLGAVARSITINVGTSTNTAPVAVDDTSITTNEDTPVITSVLANDTDADSDPLTVTSATPTAAHGTVACTSTQCTYTPNANYTGPDSYNYTISDGNGGSDTGTVSVTVSAVNDGPNAVDDTATATTAIATVVNVLANDTDADGDSLTVTGKTDGAHGTVTCSTTTCTYTSAVGYTGPDSFTYTISDGHGGSDTATVNVTVTAPGAGGSADVSIAKSAITSPVAVGNLSGWRIVVTNGSAAAATSVQVSDALPSGFVVSHDDSAQCSTSSGVFTCNFGSIAAGASRTVNLIGAFTRAGFIANTAQLTSANDTNATNNASSATALVNGQTCTIVGTFGDDRLLGTNGNDVICGLAGNDRINAKMGNDVVYGNEGNDRIQGLGGDDYIDGGPGRDRTLFSALLQAVRVDLRIHRATGQGVDTLVSIEEVTGSSKNDVLIGDSGENTLFGKRGNDRLVGGAGSDSLVGGKGRDRIRGGGGADSCSGGPGADTTASC
jgi:Ca2+-binding RTX toxin-like protein